MIRRNAPILDPLQPPKQIATPPTRTTQSNVRDHRIRDRFNEPVIEVSHFTLEEQPEEENVPVQKTPSQLYRNIAQIQQCKQDTESLISDLYRTITYLKTSKANLGASLKESEEENKKLRSQLHRQGLTLRELEEEKEYAQRKLDKEVEKTAFLQKCLEENHEQRLKVQREYKENLIQLKQEIESKEGYSYQLQCSPHKHIRISEDTTIL